MRPAKRHKKSHDGSAAAAAAADAAIALRVARELQEDGDPSSARQCAAHAIAKAQEASGSQMHYDDSAASLEPPPALVAAVALSTLGSLAREEDDLEASRAAYEQSLGVWPGNAVAQYELADLELHHGSFERAAELYAAAAAALPVLPAAAWHAELVATPRREAVAMASYMHALLLHLLGRCDAAVPHLHRLGVRYRLSPQLWAAVTALPAEAVAGAAAVAPRRVAHTPEVCRYAGAVPPALLKRLQAAFAPRAPFWRETRYAEQGYFSFWYDVRTPPRHAVESLAVQLLPLTGCADAVVGCEWWVHSKAASRALGNAHGHQLHFDTEEGLLYAQREVLHPAVSSVLYLSGARAAGPTVVLDQRYAAAAPARTAHVSHPADGHVLLFPGHHLHGVCPAAPAAPAPRPRPRRARARAAGRAPPLQRAASLPRRTTLMIGFWTRDVGGRAALRRAPLSACAPTPRASRRCTWPALLANPPAAAPAAPLAGGAPPTRHAVPTVSPAWEELPCGGGGGAAGDAWAGRGLRVPDARNNHFFVRGMEEFLFDFLERAEGEQGGEPGTAARAAEG